MSKVLHRFVARNFITDRWLQQNPDVIIECWGCGKSIQKDDPRRKFCTRNCYKRYWRASRKIPAYRQCAWCNNEFELSRSDKIYCSIKCIRDNSRFIRGIPRLGHFKRICGECKIPFIVIFPAQRYCSFKHFQRHRKASKRYGLTDDDIQVWNQMREKFWFGEI